MTAVARDQFKVQGPVVRHLPTGARFTKGSNVIDWGKAGDRLSNGDQYPRREVMHTALRILDEIEDTGAPVTHGAHRYLQRRRPGEGTVAPVQFDGHERRSRRGIFRKLVARGKPRADSDQGNAPEATARPAGGLTRSLLIVPLCAVALTMWSFELSLYGGLFELLAAYVTPQALTEVPAIPCCSQWYVLR